MRKYLILLSLIIVGCGSLKRNSVRSIVYNEVTDVKVILDSIELADKIRFPDLDKFIKKYYYTSDSTIFTQYIFINTYNKSLYTLSIGTYNDSIYQLKYRVE